MRKHILKRENRNTGSIEGNSKMVISPAFVSYQNSTTGKSIQQNHRFTVENPLPRNPLDACRTLEKLHR